MYYYCFQIVLFEDDTTVVAGTASLLDLDGVGVAHFLQMTPSTMKKMTVSGQVRL